MPRLQPDKLPKQLQPLLEVIRPKRRFHRQGGKAPDDIHDYLLEAAFVCPTLDDLAAFFWVSKETFGKWRRADMKIDVVIAQARAADAAEVLQAVRKKAIEGSAPHANIYLKAFRPDLVQPDTSISLSVGKTKIRVLPTPGNDVPAPFKTIDGDFKEVNGPSKPEEPKSGLPLFGGRVMRPA